ncbi:MAG: PAS domain S-box protein [Bacteroidales bacterium]
MSKKGKSREELIKEISDLQQAYNSLKELSEKEIKRLGKSEEKFRKVYLTSPDAININRFSDGLYISINEVFTRTMGYTEKDIIGKTSLEMNIWANPDDRKNLIKELISHREVKYFEAEFLAKNGTIVYGSMAASLIDLEGVSHIISVTRDITKRKNVENALRESEERFSKAYKTSPISFMIAKMKEGSIIEVNDEFTRISGFTREETIGNTTLGLNIWVHEKDRQKMIATLQDGRSMIRQETQLRAKNGSILTTLLSSQVIQLGNEYCIISSIEDITERKRIEVILQESEKKFRRIFDNVQDLYYETLIDGTIIEISPSIRTLSKDQYKREDLVGKSIDEFYQIPEKRQSLLSALKEKGMVSDFEITLKNRDGSLIPCSIMAKISVDDQGCPEKIIGSMRDITERKKFENELIKAREKAEESDRLKTAFLHNISHEIRTPLNAIVGFCALIGETDIDKHTRQSYIETIMQSSDQLLAIISDIVDISNIEANLVKLVKNEVDVELLLESTCKQFLPKAVEKNVKLEWKSELSGPDALIFADRTKLIQILSNLLNNALKFTIAGSIKARCKKTDDYLEFSISDTGIGIAPENYEKIFDRFYQVQNTISKFYEGTGLGLSISKAYVELMGGKIWLTSEQGKGTIFFFTLPFERQFCEHAPVIKKTVNESFIFPIKKTILVAEDVDSNFKLISYFLSSANTRLLKASNGKEAVELALSEKNIDLILMDIKMPEMDGYTAVKLIREANVNVPIIIQTAYDDEMEKAIKIGCNGFISKPFDRRTLLKVISEYI